MPKKLLFICVDQLRFDALQNAFTPNIDKLKTHSMEFLRHYSVSAPCAPARTSLLTGNLPSAHNVKTPQSPINFTVPTLPLLLQRKNIPSYLFGFTDTIGLVNEEIVETVMKGFHVGSYMNLHRDGLADWINYLNATGHNVNYDNVFKPIHYTTNDQALTKSIYNSEHSDTTFLTNNIIRFLNSHYDEPWLLHCAYYRPHPPFIAPYPFNENVNLNGSHVEWPAINHYRDSNQFLSRWYDEIYSGSEISLEFIRSFNQELEQKKRSYYALITELDHNFGRIFSTLEELGILEDTLIILTSDHGELLGDHWLYDKGGYFNASYHVPLLIGCFNGGIRQRAIAKYSTSLDIFPTILDWFGFNPEQTDAVLRRSLLEPHNDESFAFFEYFYGNDSVVKTQGLGDFAVRSLLKGKYKLVLFDDDSPLLFDLEKSEVDAITKHNLYKDICFDMNKKMKEIWRTLAS